MKQTILPIPCRLAERNPEPMYRYAPDLPDRAGPLPERRWHQTPDGEWIDVWALAYDGPVDVEYMAQILGVTRARICQIEAEALAKLERRFGTLLLSLLGDARGRSAPAQIPHGRAFRAWLKAAPKQQRAMARRAA